MYCSVCALVNNLILKLARLETDVSKGDVQTGASHKHTSLGKQGQINHVIL